MKKSYTLTPLSIQERASQDGFTHSAIVTADDLTQTTANTAQAISLGTIPKGAVIRKSALIIRKPLRAKTDTAFNSVTASLGDTANSATQLIAATETNANKNITFNDGVTSTDTSLVSATATFVAGDVGKTVTGTGIPAGTTIASRTNGTTVVLSAATTATATGVSITIGGRTATPVTTPKVITTNTNANTPYTASDAVKLTLTPLPATKALNSINDGELMVLVQIVDLNSLANVKSIGPITKA